MLIEQIIEFEWKGPGPPNCTCAPITSYFHDKRKISKKKSMSALLYFAKTLLEAMCLTSSYLDQITKFSTKM